MPEDIWDAVYEINLQAVWLTSRAAVPHLKQSKSGTIINVASTSAFVAYPMSACYCATKSGVGMLIGAQLIPRLGKPEEIAKLACFLASDDASFITGAVYLIDGGAFGLAGNGIEGQLALQSGSLGRTMVPGIILSDGGAVTETLFQFDRHNYLDCQSTYRGDGNREWYLGDYSIEPGSLINARAERRTVGAFSIIRVRSFTRMSFKRTLSHIRQDGIDVAVLWFVKQGSLKISHSGGDTTARAGDFAVTKSATPFFMECMTDANSMHEVFEVVMPAFSLRHLFPHSLTTGYCMSVEGREFAIAERMLRDLFEDAGELSEQISQVLLDSALLVLSEAVRTRGTHSEVQRSLAAKRLQDVLRHIDTHLSSPELSIATVSEGCGISQRYLFFLLKLHGVSFSTLVWEKRLQIAREWLSTSKSAQAAVSEIAYRVGFKSAAHFSRMFKRAFNMTPGECRAAARARPADAAVTPPGLQ